MEKQLSRIESLRNDLKLQIQELKPSPGSTLVISPRNDCHVMTDTYMEFIVEALKNIVGPQVKFIILPHNQLSIEHKKETDAS